MNFVSQFLILTLMLSRPYSELSSDPILFSHRCCQEVCLLLVSLMHALGPFRKAVGGPEAVGDAVAIFISRFRCSGLLSLLSTGLLLQLYGWWDLLGKIRGLAVILKQTSPSGIQLGERWSIGSSTNFTHSL